MGHPLTVQVFPDPAAVSEAAAAQVVAQARAAIAERGRFTLGLAGGRTPRALYQLLAGAYRDQIDWTRVHLFWGDERYVPHDHALSNFRMVRESLLEQVPVPAGQVNPMPTGSGDPAADARAYEALLAAAFGPGVPVLDLVLLGMGPDGHTASLFPGTPAAAERERLVTAVEALIEPPVRLSLTLPVLTQARSVLFLVTGADKRPVWDEIRADVAGVATVYPAAAVALEGQNVIWYVDEALQ